MAGITQEEFDAMLQVSVAQGLPGGNYTSKYSGEEIDAGIDAALSSQQTVELTEVSSPPRKYCAANQLQNEINKLPRLLTENLYFEVTGELDTAVEVKNFYGPGSLAIIGNGFTMLNRLQVLDCAIRISLSGVAFQETSTMASWQLLNVEGGRRVAISNCTFTGLGDASTATAIRVVNETLFECSNAKISGCSRAVLGGVSSVLRIGSGQFSGNKSGILADGGIVLLGSGVPKFLGGASNENRGGLIADGDGKLVYNAT